MACWREHYSEPQLRLFTVNNSEPMKTFRRILNVFLLVGFANSLSAFTYTDTDVLLVFRRTNATNDVLFNLGSISNYLGLANGTNLAVTNFDFSRVQTVFGSDLTGVKYVVAAVTTPGNP